MSDYTHLEMLADREAEKLKEATSRMTDAFEEFSKHLKEEISDLRRRVKDLETSNNEKLELIDNLTEQLAQKT